MRAPGGNTRGFLFVVAQIRNGSKDIDTKDIDTKKRATKNTKQK